MAYRGGAPYVALTILDGPMDAGIGWAITCDELIAHFALRITRRAQQASDINAPDACGLWPHIYV